eukprot:454247-Prymnesium_polylepis.1
MMHETIYMKPAPDTYVFTCIPSGPLFPIQYMYSIGRESRALCCTSRTSSEPSGRRSAGCA